MSGELHFIKGKTGLDRDIPVYFDAGTMTLQPIGGTMKIIVQHQAAVEGEGSPEQTCVWIVGDDGETLPYSESNPTAGEGTAYLKPGQEVTIEIATEVKGSVDEGQIVTPIATMGDIVGNEAPVSGTTTDSTVDPDLDQKADERPGDNDTSSLR